MKYGTPVSAALLIPCLLASPLDGDRLSFTLAGGSTITKTFTQSLETNLGSIEVLINGMDWGWGDYSMGLVHSQTVAVADTYGAIEAGRPLRVERTFETISQEMVIDTAHEVRGFSTQAQTETLLGTSELANTTVLFTWDEDEYSKAFHQTDRRSDEELLEGLTEDMDLRFLLPAEEVIEGDEWDLELSRLPDLLAPGGYYAWDLAAEGMDRSLGSRLDPVMMGNLRRMLGDMLEGTARAKYIGEADGLAVLELDIEVWIRRDASDPVSRIMGGEFEWLSPGIDRLDIELTLDLQGRARWDVGAGHLSDLELTGRLAITVELAILLDHDPRLAIDLEVAMSGAIEQTIEFGAE